MALFDENMAVGKSKYLVTLYLHKLKQPSDRVISGGPLILQQKWFDGQILFHGEIRPESFNVAITQPILKILFHKTF